MVHWLWLYNYSFLINQVSLWQWLTDLVLFSISQVVCPTAAEPPIPVVGLGPVLLLLSDLGACYIPQQVP